MPDDLKNIVQRMVEAGEPEADIALVIQHYKAPAATQPTAEPRSLGGFLENVASSGGRFLKDTASGVVGGAKALGDIMNFGNPEGQMARMEQAKALASNAPRIIGSIGQAAKDRYGGLEQIKKTLYEDPVGVLGDVSTLAGGVGLAGQAGGMGKLARAAGAVSDATNPMRAVGAVAQPIARGTANTIVRGTLRAPAAVRQDFGGSKAIADAVLDNRVFSEASAQKKLSQSVSKADQMLADAQAAGVGGVPRRDVARAVVGEPQGLADLDVRLGETPSMKPMDTAKAILRKNPKEIALTDAQEMKRRAQTRAFEAGAENNSVKKATEKAKAQALREGIEKQVPDVKPVNQRSQDLLGTQQAFAAAEDRPRALTNFLSLLGGAGGFASGGPAGAAIVPLLMKAMDSPRFGAMTGIGIDSIGRAAGNPAANRAALLARLLGQNEE